MKRKTIKPYQAEIDALRQRITDFKAGKLSPEEINADWLKFANPEAAIQELLDFQANEIKLNRQAQRNRKAGK